MAVFLRKYGEATYVDFPLTEHGSPDLTLVAVFDHVDDTYISYLSIADVWANVNIGINPVHLGNGIYRLILDAGVMFCKILSIRIVDQTALKVWADVVIIIETFGHPLAMHQFDLDSMQGARGMVSVS